MGTWKIDGRDLEYTPVTSFTCPFCRKQVDVIALDQQTAGIESAPALIHEQPTCPQFDSSEPQEFVRIALRERVSSLAGDQPKPPSRAN